MEFVPFPAANISTALTLWKCQCLGDQAWQNYRVISNNCYMSGVSVRELAKSTGSRRCSESNSISLPKWRKNSNKQKNVVQHKVSQVPTVQHKHWVNAEEKLEQSVRKLFQQYEKCPLCLRDHGTGEQGSVKGIAGESHQKSR